MTFLALVTYFVAFALLMGSAFALMYANIRSINEAMDKPKQVRHPEAPEPGETVMYVDVSDMNSDEFKAQKDRLEKLL